MAEQSWFDGSGDRGSAFGAAAAPPPFATRDEAYELRPLTTGEVLDRTFFLYRNNFWLFAGLSAIAAAVSVVTSLLQNLYLHFAGAGPEFKGSAASKVPLAAAFSHLGPVIAMSLISVVLYLVVYSLTQAATTSAVTAIYLGDRTSVKESLGKVSGRWLRYVAIAAWQAWSAGWLYFVLVLPAIGGMAFLSRRTGGGAGAFGAIAGLGLLLFVGAIGGMVYGVIAYIRNSLAVPAEVMEGLAVRAAMRRSKTLAAGSKGRIFLLFLLLIAIYIVVGAVEVPVVLLAAKARGMQVVLMQAILLFVNFVVTTLVAPVGAIGLTLFYVDQRVRKEGFDLEVLMERAGLPDRAGQPGQAL